jgi:ribosomal-protein-alanine N-acetyltransferase
MSSPGVSGILLRSEGMPIGFALCRVTVDEAELLTIAVAAAERRRGLGRALLAAVIECVRAAGATALFLEVGADNPAAIALYRRNDFRPVGRRSGYYQRGSQPPADALVMRRIFMPGDLTPGG